MKKWRISRPFRSRQVSIPEQSERAAYLEMYSYCVMSISWKAFITMKVLGRTVRSLGISMTCSTRLVWQSMPPPLQRRQSQAISSKVRKATSRAQQRPELSCRLMCGMCMQASMLKTRKLWATSWRSGRLGSMAFRRMAWRANLALQISPLSLTDRNAPQMLRLRISTSMFRRSCWQPSDSSQSSSSPTSPRWQCLVAARSRFSPSEALVLNSFTEAEQFTSLLSPCTKQTACQWGQDCVWRRATLWPRRGWQLKGRGLREMTQQRTSRVLLTGWVIHSLPLISMISVRKMLFLWAMLSISWLKTCSKLQLRPLRSAQIMRRRPCLSKKASLSAMSSERRESSLLILRRKRPAFLSMERTWQLVQKVLPVNQQNCLKLMSSVNMFLTYFTLTSASICSMSTRYWQGQLPDTASSLISVNVSCSSLASFRAQITASSQTRSPPRPRSQNSTTSASFSLLQYSTFCCSCVRISVSSGCSSRSQSHPRSSGKMQRGSRTESPPCSISRASRSSSCTCRMYLLLCLAKRTRSVMAGLSQSQAVMALTTRTSKPLLRPTWMRCLATSPSTIRSPSSSTAVSTHRIFGVRACSSVPIVGVRSSPAAPSTTVPAADEPVGASLAILRCGVWPALKKATPMRTIKRMAKQSVVRSARSEGWRRGGTLGSILRWSSSLQREPNSSSPGLAWELNIQYESISPTRPRGKSRGKPHPVRPNLSLDH